MRILIFHGYLLAGTGSNVYNARLAEALVGEGHDVDLVCQERHPDEHAFVSRAGDWDSGRLELRALPASRGSGGAGAASTAAAGGGCSCTVYRPDIGGLLPVYVPDRYEGLEARPFPELSEVEIERYITANVEAVREVVARARPEVALANHLVMGPVILARALGGKVPYAVKVHGSALEYTVKPHPQRFLGLAREGLAPARAVLVGSRHTAESLWQALDEEGLAARTRLGPPGVDVGRFTPAPDVPVAAARMRRLADTLAGGPARDTHAAGGSAFERDPAEAASALRRLDPPHDRVVAYVGKLIVSKGVDLLVAAWPLVLAEVPQAKLVLIGFGAYRDGLTRLLGALDRGDLEEARAIGRAGRSLEGAAEQRPLRHLLAFLDGLSGEAREHYLLAAAGLSERVVLTGRLEHEELPDVLAACEAIVVPSTFPEAFGMVAVEGAACGAFPISAAHSGLAEVGGELASAVPAEAAGWLGFPVDDDAVPALAARVIAWLTADEKLRRNVRSAIVERVRERWSWQGVARSVTAAAEGRLGALDEVPARSG